MKIFNLLFTVIVLSLSTSANAFNASEYYKNKCLSCHTIGKGDGKGPDLKPVFASKTHGNKVKSKKHTNAWLIKFMKYPEGMISGDPDDEDYKKVDKHAEDLWKHFNKKFMTDVEISDSDFNSLLNYINKEAKKK